MSTFRRDQLRALTAAAFIDTAVMFARNHRTARTTSDLNLWWMSLDDARVVAFERGMTEALETAIRLDAAPAQQKGGAP